MKKTPNISDAEWEVMKVLWKNSPMTANAIVEELTGNTSWKRETIRTLINRLVQKKALGFKKKGRHYDYFPLVSEAECVRAETKSFLSRLGSSSIEPMLAAFVEEKKMTPEKIARLKQILDQEGKRDRNGKQK